MEGLAAAFYAVLELSVTLRKLRNDIVRTRRSLARGIALAEPHHVPGDESMPGSFMFVQLLQLRSLVSRDQLCTPASRSREIERPEADLRSFVELGASSMSHPSLGCGLLDWLVGVTRQTGPHLTELRQLGNIAFISHSGVLSLDLDNLLERLRTEQLFESTRTVLERLLRISGDLRGDSLERLVRLTKGADRGIKAVLASSLNLITIPLNVRHLMTFLSPAWRGHVACEDSYGMPWCAAQ